MYACGVVSPISSLTLQKGSKHHEGLLLPLLFWVRLNTRMSRFKLGDYPIFIRTLSEAQTPRLKMYRKLVIVVIASDASGFVSWGD